MATMNIWVGCGNVTRDIELRYIANGTAVCDIGMAINERFKGSDGNMQEKTIFVDCTAWGRQAEIAGEYLQKGSPLLVHGRLSLDTWQDKETGQNRQKLKVVVERLQLLGGGGGGGNGGGNGGGQRSNQGGGNQGGGNRNQSRPPANSGNRRPPAAPPASSEGDGDYYQDYDSGGGDGGGPQDDIPF